MPTNESLNSNYASYRMEAQVDLSSAAAVSATRGDGMTCTKTGTGAYSLVLKAGGGMKLVKELQAKAQIKDPRASSTKAASVASVTQDSETDDITIEFVTSATLGGAAADETTAAVTVNIECTIQTVRMTNPFD